MTNEKLIFLKEYEVLCRKHKLALGACGCCDSPYLVEMQNEKALCFYDYGEIGRIQFEKARGVYSSIKNGEYIENLGK